MLLYAGAAHILRIWYAMWSATSLTRMHTYTVLENLKLSKWLLFQSVHWILYSKSIFAALGYVNNIKQDQLRSTSVHERVPLSTNGGSNGLAVGAREDTTVVSWCHVFYGLGSLIKYENKPKTRLREAKHILNAGVKNIFFTLWTKSTLVWIPSRLWVLLVHNGFAPFHSLPGGKN